MLFRSELDFRAAREHRVAPWSGVLITAVHANSPADEAGLHEGDILIEYDGHRMVTARNLHRHVERTAPGSVVKVEVLRAGQRQKYDVKLREQAPPTPVITPPTTRKPEVKPQ